MIPVYVLVLVCINSFWCSGGDVFQTDAVYMTQADCKTAGEQRIKSGWVFLCLDGVQRQDSR